MQSLSSDKASALAVECGDKELSLLCLTETWGRDSTIESCIFPGCHLTSYFNRKIGRGGGVAIWSRQGLNVQSLSLDIYGREGNIEICGVKWFAGVNLVYTFILCYRPPRGNFYIFYDNLCLLLISLYKPAEKLVLLGDFNLNSLPDYQINMMYNLLSTYNLVPIVDEPTRIVGQTCSTLDQVFVDLDSKCKCSVRDCHISDHRYVFLKTDVGFRGSEYDTYIYKRQFGSKNVESFVNCVRRESWSDVFGASGVDAKFACLHDTLLHHLNSLFPLKHYKVATRGDRWTNHAARTSSENLKHLHSLHRSGKISKHNYLIAKKNHYRLLRDLKREHFSKRILYSNNKNRAAWKVVSDLLGKIKAHENISLDINDTETTDPVQLAKEFNTFFIDVPKSIASMTNVSSNYTNEFAFMNKNSMFLSPVDEQTVRNVIVYKLKGSYSAGYDDFPGFLLKKIVNEIAVPFAHIVNCSFSCGTFPGRLKVGKVIPVYKKGSKKNVENYRPISLCSVFSKVFEYCFMEQITSFLNSFKVLYSSQHGFRERHSTMTALLQFHEDIIDAFERGESPSGIFCDLSRAFDCVNHKILLSKLYKCGIRGTPYEWVESYLTNRTQYVEIRWTDGLNILKDFRSPRSEVNIGVPQGSILGPLLFIIYINDLCTAVDSPLTLYADDASLRVSEGDSSKYQAKMESTVRSLCDWFSSNSLYLNTSKTKHIMFHARQKRQLPDIQAVVNGVRLLREKSTKFLGVTFDENLNFKEHCEALICKINARCYQIRVLRAVLSDQELRSCYYAFVHNLLSYGIVVWGSSTASSDVFLAQKRVIRCIAGVKPTVSCRSFFKGFKILPLSCIYIKELVTHVYGRVESVRTRDGIHSHDTRNKHNLVVPYRRLNLTVRTPYCLGLRLFNLLPEFCRKSSNVAVFKARVNDLLLSMCCYSVDEYIQALSGM